MRVRILKKFIFGATFLMQRCSSMYSVQPFSEIVLLQACSNWKKGGICDVSQAFTQEAANGRALRILQIFALCGFLGGSNEPDVTDYWQWLRAALLAYFPAIGTFLRR